MANIEELEQKINYKFNKPEILKEALTHKSFFRNQNTSLQDYERLEFLGDAILQIVVSEYLFENFDLSEGKMTYLRANMVNKNNLNQVGKSLNLHHLALLSQEEKREFGYARESIVANIFESVTAAIYLDSGKNWEITKNFLHQTLIKNSQNIIAENGKKDAKTVLQEFCQKEYKTQPKYKIVHQSGLDHQKIFKAIVIVAEQIAGAGKGKSKQLAETEAAKKAIENLQIKF